MPAPITCFPMLPYGSESAPKPASCGVCHSGCTRVHLYVLRCWVYVSVYFGFDRKTYTDGTFGHPSHRCQMRSGKARESDYTLFDGQGLHLLVKTNGKKVWRFKYSRPDGRAGLATFGSYPALSLKAARNRRAEARELLAHGIDPIENAKQSKVEADRARRNTFEAVARTGMRSVRENGNPIMRTPCCAGWRLIYFHA